MSIQRAMLLFTFTVILGMLGLLFFSSKLMMVNIELTEKQQIEVEIKRGKAGIDQQLNDLGALVTDWAGWDDPYEYITNKDTAFIDNNVDAAMMQSAQLSFIAFLDNTGKVIFSRAINLETADEIPVSEPIQQFLTNTEHPQVFTSNEAYNQGLVWDGDEAIMMGSYPIIGNSRLRPINGTLIMGRKVSLSVVDLGNDTYLNQTILSLSEGLRGKSSSFQASIKAGESVVEADDMLVAGYQAIKDINGNTTLLMKIEQPRTIVKQSQQMAWSYGALLLVLTGIFAVFLTFATGRIISRPLVVLQKELSELVSRHDFEKRVTVSGLKENQGVSRGINQLMEMNQHLAEATWAGTRKMKEQLAQIEAKNEEMEKTKIAIMNILEDERELEEQLRAEKTTIEEKVAERTRELVEEQAKLKGSIDSLPVGYLMIDKNGNSVMANKAVGKIMSNIDNVGVVAQVKTWVAQDKEVLLDEVAGLPAAPLLLAGLTHADGYLDLSVVPIQVREEDGKEEIRIGWVVLLADVTEAKNLQRSRDEFFSIASHELRTPLTAIRGNTSLIRDYYPEIMKDESVHQIIDDIHEASVRLIAIVNDFLDASRLELKKIEFKIEKFDLVPLLTKVSEAIAPSAKEKQIGWDMHLGDIHELTVSGDRSRTEQILYNFMGNALKFTKEGGVTIELKQVNGMAEVWIIDTGMGIPDENQRLLFRKFQQAGKSVFTREASQGSGMGLYISKLLAEGMGGSVRLEKSELGKGSTFVLALTL